MRRACLRAGIAAILIASPVGQRLGRPAPASGVPEAAADTFRVRSAILGRDRTVFISLPASYARTTRSYPILLVLDGEANFDEATIIASTLARLGHVPEAIVVGIPNATSDPDDRVHDLTPPGLSVSGSSLDEGGDEFLDFIERELLPAVSERYRGGPPRILVGHSSGGVIATYAAATRPEGFQAVVSIDAPIHLGDDWLAKRLVERAGRDSPPLRYVSLETRFGWSDGRWAELEAAAPASWVIRRERIEGESHESMGFLGMYQGIKFAFADYSIVGAPIPPRGTAFGAFGHYHAIESSFGVRLPPPAPVLRRLIEDLLIEGRPDQARRAFAWLVEGYGRPSDLDELESSIARVEALPPLAETVEDLKATPMPSPEEIRPFIGEWKGHDWMHPEARTELTLRIREVDGEVSGETIHRFGADHELVQPIEYMRVVSGGLEFGQMNGIRPMGMIVYHGHLDGEVLEGVQRFRGIVLPLPDGHMPPDIHFRLVKQPDGD